MVCARYDCPCRGRDNELNAGHTNGDRSLRCNPRFVLEAPIPPLPVEQLSTCVSPDVPTFHLASSYLGGTVDSDTVQKVGFPSACASTSVFDACAGLTPFALGPAYALPYDMLPLTPTSASACGECLFALQDPPSPLPDLTSDHGGVVATQPLALRLEDRSLCYGGVADSFPRSDDSTFSPSGADDLRLAMGPPSF